MVTYSNEHEVLSPTDGRIETPGWRWEISWSAVLAGCAVALGFLTLFLLFGTAVGLSSIDPYSITRNENSSGWGIATIAWVAVSSLASLFIGAWFSSHISRQGHESSMMQGAVLWGICTLVVGLALGRSQFISQPAAKDAKTMTYYSSLNDKEFATFMLENARNWKPGAAETPVNVSVDTQSRVNPNKIANNKELARFVESNTGLNKSQTQEFLEQNKNSIANAQADAQKRWEEFHSMDLAIADRDRRAAAAAAWTLSGVAFFGLVMAFAGSYVGWQSRDRALFVGHPVKVAPPKTVDIGPRA